MCIRDRSESGLIAIAGGKLTGYRKMAQRVVDKASKRLKEKGVLNIKDCQTKNIELTVDKLDRDQVDELINRLSQKLQRHNLDSFFAWYLVTNYGKSAEEIIEDISNFKGSPEVALTRSELSFCFRNEMVQTLSDFYIRRTGKLFFEIQNIKLTKELIICLLYTSPSPRDATLSRMPSSA